MDLLYLNSIFEALVFGIEIGSSFKHFSLHDFEVKIAFALNFFLNGVISEPILRPPPPISV